jgi:hypothetical protein
MVSRTRDDGERERESCVRAGNGTPVVWPVGHFTDLTVRVYGMYIAYHAVVSDREEFIA